MANGPCGEEFKAAFSCFVYSTEEPKGVDCIEKFKGMQDCFRKYPEVYGDELEDEEEDVRGGRIGEEVETGDRQGILAKKGEGAVGGGSATEEDVEAKKTNAEAASNTISQHNEEVSESDSVVPKAWHDQRDLNEEAAQEKQKQEQKH
jgi:mitochondrial intermembrane space import and assembly protein 40